MAETGDPKGPSPEDAHRPAQDDPDALVGFVSPASLTGQLRPRPPEPESEPEAEPEPDLFDPPAPDPFDRTAPTMPTARFETSKPVSVAPEDDSAARSHGRSGRRPMAEPEAAPPVAAPMGLFAVYVLILLAVPTLGVAALAGLVAVTGREGPREPMAASHFTYQGRTLWGGAVGSVIGALLVVVNVGVLVLFFLAVWVLARGAYGVLRLKSGKPIPHPRGWLF
ncbi:hypothetical protein [Brevundimonas sp. SORGH_AS_0993]|uniref:hypothetical protein n=1 Tax=Brevundimonas sp. SORGH_AS_0993 TaxID=3041794 RepID=UPI00277FDB03|nr:hypothetical protein [Brevundimonas sp. SORGH_AS_0993]MDQ1155473.1 putative membrane protein [Brevundimonas sp. SORGH_AS_0993]